MALRWVFWWNSTEGSPDDVTDKQVSYELNTDFETAKMGADELVALVALVTTWQAGLISMDSAHILMRNGEVIPTSRSNAEEARLIGGDAKAMRQRGAEAAKLGGVGVLAGNGGG